MKKQISTPLTDEYIEAINGMKEAETGPFFYTRLKARMEKEAEGEGWNTPVKPVWLVGLLAIILFINAFFLVTQVKETKQTSTQNTTLQNFATGYDLTVSTSF